MFGAPEWSQTFLRHSTLAGGTETTGHKSRADIPTSARVLQITLLLEMHNSSFKFCQQEKQYRTSYKRLVGRRKKAERPVARNEERERAQRLELSRLVMYVSGIAEVLAKVRGVRVLEAVGEGTGALLE